MKLLKWGEPPQADLCSVAWVMGHKSKGLNDMPSLQPIGALEIRKADVNN